MAVLSPVDRPDEAEDEAVVGFEEAVVGFEEAAAEFEAALVDAEPEPAAAWLMVLMVDVLISEGSCAPHGFCCWQLLVQARPGHKQRRTGSPIPCIRSMGLSACSWRQEKFRRWRKRRPSRGFPKGTRQVQHVYNTNLRSRVLPVADVGDSSGIGDLLDTDERAGSDWSVRFKR